MAQKQREVLSADRTGAFTMDVVEEILSLKCLEKAKETAFKWLESVDNARPENLRKAKSMVEKSKTIQNLALAMSNFILAFQGLAVIK
jgi:hypothetical protein